MATHKLAATTRTEFGKGAARRLRRAEQVPGVIYGEGSEPLHISLPGRETFLLLREADLVLEVSVDGAAPVVVRPQEVQRDPITGFLEHVDLMRVKGE
jgi:ribosomal L25p family protein